MNELLSADELSDLLTAVNEGQAPAAVAAGDEPERAVQVLDFRKPSRLSRDQLRAIQQLHDSVAVALSSALSDAVQAPIEVSLVAVEAVAFGAFNAALPSPSCIQTFRAVSADAARPIATRGLVALDIPLAFSIIERLLGGRGQALERTRPLTDIEKAVVAGPLHTITERLASAWQRFAPMEFRPASIEMNPKSAQILAVQEVALQIIFALGGDACVGDLHVCLPLPMIEQLLPRGGFDLGALLGDRASEADDSATLRRAVGAAPVRVAAELGQVALSVRDLIGLKPGDVLRLDRRLGDPLDVTVESTPHLAGQPGLVGPKVGLQIIDPARSPAAANRQQRTSES